MLLVFFAPLKFFEMVLTDLRASREERLALLVAQSTTTASPPPAPPRPPCLLQQHVGISRPRDGTPLHDVPWGRRSRRGRRRQSRPLQLGRKSQQAAVSEGVGGVAVALGAEVQVAGEDAKPRPAPPHCTTP